MSVATDAEPTGPEPAGAELTDATYDVVVVGSGGAGLVAACVAADQQERVLVLESTASFGGTTALSGGQLWLPGAAAMGRAGHPDDQAGARTYLGRVALRATPAELLDAFIDQAAAFADYLEGDLEIPVLSVARPDYHPDWEGAAFGRTLEPLPVSTSELGPWANRIRTSSSRRPITGPESRAGLAPEIVERREADGVRTQGAGLVAGLVRAARCRGVQFELEARVIGLQAAPGGWTLTLADRPTPLTATTVVIAAGGFARSAQLRRAFLPLVDIAPTAAPGTDGDGLTLGLSAGGQIRGMSEAWWTPAVSVPGEMIDGQPAHRNVVRELAYPGSILVNVAGRRFVDEASSYNDLAKAFFAFDPATHTFPHAAAWLVFDAEFQARRTVAGVPAGTEPPSWFVKGGTIEELAARTGIDSSGLLASVAALRDQARTGIDPDFGRGANDHDRYNGDPDHAPNPCLGAIHTGPFYAVPVVLGANGTKGGLTTDAEARVLDRAGSPIAGLFAVGESAAALMGPGYAGSGAALGPSLVAAFSLRTALTSSSAD